MSSSWLTAICPPDVSAYSPLKLKLSFDNTSVAWDPNKKNHTDLVQSAVLRVTFHSARMSIRRPSLALWGDRASTPESNLALEVCVTSALAVLKVMETVGLADLGYTMGSGHCFSAGTFVLLGMWDMKRKDPSNPTLLTYAKAIETSLALLSAAEARRVVILLSLAPFVDPPSGPKWRVAFG